MSYHPKNDGVDHINIYSRGKTELGQLLSNFACTPFELPDDGKFLSVEGYWYWLLTGKKHDQLRLMSGFQTKQAGRRLREQLAGLDGDDEIVFANEPDFQSKIKLALAAKLDQTPYLKFLMLDSELPFTHYYVFQGIKKNAGYEWVVAEWERLRTELKRNSHGETEQNETQQA